MSAELGLGLCIRCHGGREAACGRTERVTKRAAMMSAFRAALGKSVGIVDPRSEVHTRFELSCPKS